MNQLQGPEIQRIYSFLGKEGALECTSKTVRNQIAQTTINQFVELISKSEERLRSHGVSDRFMGSMKDLAQTSTLALSRGDEIEETWEKVESAFKGFYHEIQRLNAPYTSWNQKEFLDASSISSELSNIESQKDFYFLSFLEKMVRQNKEENPEFSQQMGDLLSSPDLKSDQHLRAEVARDWLKQSQEILSKQFKIDSSTVTYFPEEVSLFTGFSFEQLGGIFFEAAGSGQLGILKCISKDSRFGEFDQSTFLEALDEAYQSDYFECMKFICENIPSDLVAEEELSGYRRAMAYYDRLNLAGTHIGIHLYQAVYQGNQDHIRIILTDFLDQISEEEMKLALECALYRNEMDCLEIICDNGSSKISAEEFNRAEEIIEAYNSDIGHMLKDASYNNQIGHVKMIVNCFSHLLSDDDLGWAFQNAVQRRHWDCAIAIWKQRDKFSDDHVSQSWMHLVRHGDPIGVRRFLKITSCDKPKLKHSDLLWGYMYAINGNTEGHRECVNILKPWIPPTFFSSNFRQSLEIEEVQFSRYPDRGFEVLFRNPLHRGKSKE